MEFFTSLHAHSGVPFSRQFEGIRKGMADAKSDFGIHSAIIPGVNRELGPDKAEEYLDQILENNSDDIIGLGLDYFETPFPPEPFADVWARAKRAGLRLTAHAGEAGPAQYIEASLDVLNVERVDHGYNIVDDPALVARCKEMGILFTCCPSTSIGTTPYRDLSAPNHPIRRMNEAGLVVSINSDDPPMFLTDLSREYEIAFTQLGFSAQDIKRSVLATIDHAWVDDSTKKSWRAEWMPEIDRITAELEQI
ncbi:MAG: adenosine deaminase [Blastopirellula sp.]|nr:MAG: adenosine deaminase [Blastopirellula sp.]